MKLYQSQTIPQKERYIHNGEKLFLKQVENGFEGKRVTVDEVHTDIPMIIQKHTNPLNKNLHDMKAKYLDSVGDFMHMGNLVRLGTDKIYMAVTEPSSNGIYSEYKILPLTDDMTFTVDESVQMKCVVANKGFYDETSFVNDTNVFEDKDTRATIVQYNDKTSQLRLFDDVFINNEQYRIVKIDNHTFKEYNEEFGVLQLVIVDTPFGEILCNDKTPLKGIIMTARVKDKILNSISRELLCEHNRVKRGDYIDFTYDRDGKGTMVKDTYLITNKPTMGEGYDTSLMYLCESNVNLLNDVGEVVSMPFYYEDNRVRIDKTTENDYVSLSNSSYQIVIQRNEITSKLGKDNKINRIMINGEVYSITGDDPFTEGIISLGLEKDQLSPDDDLEKGVANYKSQMDKINGGNQDRIVEANGEDKLYKGYENEYYLDGVIGDVTWSVDKDWITLTLIGDRCKIKFNDLKYVNETVILQAINNGVTYTKSIKTAS